MSRKPATPEDRGRPYYKSHEGQRLVRLEWNADQVGRAQIILRGHANERRLQGAPLDEYLLLDLANRIRTAE